MRLAITVNGAASLVRSDKHKTREIPARVYVIAVTASSVEPRHTIIVCTFSSN